jgi:hypothetical protein
LNSEFYFQTDFSLLMFLGGDCLVDEIEVSENREALILLAGTVAGAATTFVASLPIPFEIKAPVTALVTTVTAAILLYWKNKVNKQ